MLMESKPLTTGGNDGGLTGCQVLVIAQPFVIRFRRGGTAAHISVLVVPLQPEGHSGGIHFLDNA